MEGGAVGHNFERYPHKDHPCQVWFNLFQQFQLQLKFELIWTYTKAAMDNNNFIPIFLFLAWRSSWLEVEITGHNFGRGPSKEHDYVPVIPKVRWTCGKMSSKNVFGPIKGYSLLDQTTSRNLNTSSVEYVNVL